MDEAARRRRREADRRRVYLRRRIVALGILGLLVVVVVRACGEDGEDERRERAAAPPELPRGGRTIFPRYQAVGFYGAPQSGELGALGIGTPDQAVRRLNAQARPYRRGGRPVMPVLELIVAIASDSPGADGLYRNRQSPRTIERYLAAARRARGLLLLDIQPGRADFMTEVRALERFLVQPDVGLALDAEWHIGPGEVPGQVFGSVDAGTVNAISAYLADIVRRRRLPQKLFVLHQFTPNMIRDRARVVRRRELATVVNVDGFGDRVVKKAKYLEFTRGTPLAKGLKLFYREDTNLLAPRDVLRIRPRPDLVVYE